MYVDFFAKLENICRTMRYIIYGIIWSAENLHNQLDCSVYLPAISSVCLTIILSLMVNIIWKKREKNLVFFYCKADKCLMVWNNIFTNRLRSVFQTLLEVFPLFDLWFSDTKIPEPIYILANIYVRNRLFGTTKMSVFFIPEWILVATFK